MIEGKNLHRTYRNGAVPLHVLRGINLRVEVGEFVAITGASGAGKSTLLHLLAGLDLPSEGEVLWHGKPVSRMSDGDRAKWRNASIGIVFQFYHLLPELTALENVMLPGLVAGTRRSELKGRALERLTQVGLAARASHKPSQLSGGELQRVAIARALINEPKVLFCDEPTGNLDSATGEAVTELLLSVRKARGLSLVLATHQHELAELADRWLVLKDGQLISEKQRQLSAVSHQRSAKTK